jgi:GT2 family glycosyltransferase/LmbE family N-acetylglucosaminyl deacetylase
MENKLIPYQATECINANSIIVFAPHPDDEVFGCGGAILRHVAAGVSVHVVIVSDGAFGAKGDEKSKLIIEREAESLKASKILAYGEPEFWRLADRSIAYGEALIQRIMETIQLSTADLIYAPSLLEMHPDHRALAMCVIEAVRRAPNKPQLALYEVGVPLQPNLLLDISDLAERKKLAMECFVSQNQKQRYDLDIAALNRYRTYTLPAEVTAAEAFILVSAEALTNDPFKLYQSEHQRQRALGLALDTTDLPLVSVIIRSMDRHTLSEALDSVALQTYTNIEVVLVNAKGSGHSSRSDWCGDFPLRFIDSDESLRRSRAANTGISNAQGDYLIFLDDDNWFMPEHIAMLVDALLRNPDKKIAYSCVIGVNKQKETTIKRCYQQFDRTLLLAENYIPIHSVLFSKTIFNGSVACCMDESLDLYEDWDFLLQASVNSDLLFVPHFSAYYRIGGSFSQDAESNNPLSQRTNILFFEKWREEWSLNDLLNITAHIQKLNDASTEQDKQLAKLTAERDSQIENLNQLTAKQDSQIENLNQLTAERDSQIENLNLLLVSLNKQIKNTITERDAAIQQFIEIRRSSSWKLTTPLRFLGHLINGDFDLASNVVRELGRRINRLLPKYLANFMRRSYSKILSTIGVMPNSSDNHSALAFIVKQRCIFTQEVLNTDLLSLPSPLEWPLIDISIVTYNSSRWVNNFVNSLLELDYPKNVLTLHFVDNSSTDSTLHDLHEITPKLTALGYKVEIIQQPNNGYGAGHNAALIRGDAPFCLVTNIDLIFEPDALSKVVASALADQEQTAAWELRQKPYEHPKFYDPVTGITNWNSHACVLLRRSAIDKVGFYDDTLFMYGEDVELSYRLRRAGFLLRYCPQAVVWHDCYEHPNQTKPMQYIGSTFANLYLRLKYGNKIDICSIPMLGLRLLLAPEAFLGSRKAITQSLFKLIKVTPKALQGRRPTDKHFPFHTWDYELNREGEFIQQSSLPVNPPLVSIITRTYHGRELYLRQALLSVAHQTYPNIEHIVVEDGGETMRNIVTEIDKVTGKSSRFLNLDKLGRSATGNAGLSAAKGRWCLFLDDDDLLFSDHIEVLVNILLEKTDVVAAYSLAWEVITDSTELVNGQYSEIDHTIPPALRQEFDYDVLLHHNFMPIQSVLFERQLFEERGGFEEDMDALEDWVLWKKYAALGNQFAYVPKVTSMFRTPSDPDKTRQRIDAFELAYPLALARNVANKQIITNSSC